MILKDGQILLGKRKGLYGEGEYAFPGGHLEHMESFTNYARREVSEEYWIKIDNIRFQYLANITKYAPKHYTHIGLVANWKSGEAARMTISSFSLPAGRQVWRQILVLSNKKGPLVYNRAAHE